MKLISFLIVTFSISGLAFAKDIRKPSNTGHVTVKAKTVAEAWSKISKDKKVAAILKKVKDEYKDCDGTLGGFSENQVVQVYSGLGGAGSFATTSLLTLSGGCGGTGKIEEVALIAQISNTGNIDDEKSLYQFEGFVRANLLPMDAKSHSAFGW